jgi:hypothetical protein
MGVLIYVAVSSIESIQEKTTNLCLLFDSKWRNPRFQTTSMLHYLIEPYPTSATALVEHRPATFMMF